MLSNSTDSRIVVKLTPAQVAALDRRVAADGVTRSDLIRQGLGQVLAMKDKDEDTKDNARD